jgi:DNA-binding Lrp family transcriptional regulator
MEAHAMRPIASEQDPLRYPLNEIFGTRAHVRLLRVMAVEVDGPLTAADIARRAGLTVPGTHKALGKLLRSGFISRVGGGRKCQYEIRRSDRLIQTAIELFQSERNRYERLLSALKHEIKNLTPPPHAAWIQTVLREIDEPLILGLLHESLYLTKCANDLRTGLDGVEKDFDLTIELEGNTKVDIPDLELDGITILYGVVPNKPTGRTLQRATKTKTHRQKDSQLKLMSRKLADIIQQDASIVRRAKDHIDSLLMEEQGTAAGDLMEWRNILDSYSIQRLVRFVTSSSERAKRLRQSNPFFAILNSEERAKVADELED